MTYASVNRFFDDGCDMFASLPRWSFPIAALFGVTTMLLWGTALVLLTVLKGIVICARWLNRPIAQQL